MQTKTKEEARIRCPRCDTPTLEIHVDLINGRTFGEAHLQCQKCQWRENLPLNVHVLSGILD